MFDDDSTIISAKKFADIVRPAGFLPIYALIQGARRQISSRQIRDTINGEPDLVLTYGKSVDESFLGQFDLVFCSKFPRQFVVKWFERRWRFDGPRPAFIGAYSGLDFTPIFGLRNRQYMDIVCLNRTSDVELYRRVVPPRLQRRQTTCHFNQLFYAPKPVRCDLSRPIRHVVFFTQSIVPQTFEGRMHVLELLLDIARLHPDVRITVKLRHLPNENRNHKHQETFSYTAIAEHIARPLPINIRWSSAPMRDVLADADLCITCSSSAGIESIAAGVPTLFYTCFPRADEDVLAYKIRDILKRSNLLASREDILNLTRRQPDETWLSEMLTDPSDVESLLRAIESFLEHKRHEPVPAPGLLHAASRRVKGRARRLVKYLGLG